MEQNTTTEFSRLIKFNNAGHSYLQENQDERSTTTFALIKLLNHYQKPIERLRNQWQEEQNEQAEDIKVKYCEKEKDGLFKEKSYGEGKNLIIKKVFTPENEKKANKEIRELNKRLEEEWMSKQVDLTKVHFVDVPPSIGVAYIEAFEGFIFKPMTDEQLLAHHIAQEKKNDKK